MGFNINLNGLTNSSVSKYGQVIAQDINADATNSAVNVLEVDYNNIAADEYISVDELDSNQYYKDQLALTENYINVINSAMSELESEKKQLEENYQKFLIPGSYVETSNLMNPELSAFYKTPEEYLNYLNWYVSFDDTETRAANQILADEYSILFNEIFESTMGMTYDEYTAKLEEIESDLISLKSGKYSLTQEAKLLPYEGLATSDEYLNYVENQKSNPTVITSNDISVAGHSASFNDNLNLVALGNFLEEHPEYKNISGSNLVDDIGIDYLTDEQKMMYSYLFDTKGSDEANLYISSLEDTLNNAKGKAEAEAFLAEIDSNGIDATALNVMLTSKEGFLDGIENFGEGIENIFSTEGMITDNQYAQMYILEGLSERKLLSTTYELSTTAGNMAPAIATAAVVSAIATPAVGEVVSYTLMGASAAGNSKNQALIDGNNLLSATVYGTLVGVSEACLGMIMGNIGFMNAEAKFALQSIFQEGFEEFSQEYVDAGLQAVILGAPIDMEELGPNSIKSFVYGALMSAGSTGMQASVNVTVNGVNKIMTIAELDATVSEKATILSAKLQSSVDNAMASTKIKEETLVESIINKNTNIAEDTIFASNSSEMQASLEVNSSNYATKVNTEVQANPFLDNIINRFKINQIQKKDSFVATISQLDLNETEIVSIINSISKYSKEPALNGIDIHNSIAIKLVEEGYMLSDQIRAGKAYTKAAVLYLESQNYDKIQSANYIGEQLNYWIENDRVKLTHDIDGVEIYCSSKMEQSLMNEKFEAFKLGYNIMPDSLKRTINTVNLYDTYNPYDIYWEFKRQMPNFTSGATGGGGVMNDWTLSANSVGILYHETAHSYDTDYQLLEYADFSNKISESKIWSDAMTYDMYLNNLNGVSSYAQQSKENCEDFAEAIRLYLESPNNLSQFPNRKAVIEKYIVNNSIENVINEIGILYGNQNVPSILYQYFNFSLEIDESLIGKMKLFDYSDYNNYYNQNFLLDNTAKIFTTFDMEQSLKYSASILKSTYGINYANSMIINFLNTGDKKILTRDNNIRFELTKFNYQSLSEHVRNLLRDGATIEEILYK
ncbi:MAG: hypothetical protein R3Y21_03175 [Mycoplasmatota bacterium]